MPEQVLAMRSRFDQESAPGDGQRTLLFVVNVGWFFLSHRLPIAIAARDAGYCVHVACDFASAGEATEIESHGFVFHRLRLRRSAINPFTEMSTVRALMDLYRQLRPGVIHLVTMKPVVYGTLAARLTGAAGVVCSLSGLGSVFVASSPRTRLLKPMLRAALRRLLALPHSLVIVQNRDDLDQLIADQLVPREQLVLVRGSGVDLDEFAPSPQPNEPVRVVLPARMLRDKGVVEFAHAARALQARGVGAEFILAGGLDPENPSALSAGEIDSLVRQCGVRWLGYVDDMPALLASCHIVCLPSYREGLPKVLLEAAAAQRAIVTTDVPGCREIVEHGVTGLLARAGSADDLADQLERVLTDEPLRDSLARAARARAVAEFGVERVVARTLEVYARVAAPAVRAREV